MTWVEIRHGPNSNILKVLFLTENHKSKIGLPPVQQTFSLSTSWSLLLVFNSALHESVDTLVGVGTFVCYVLYGRFTITLMSVSISRCVSYTVLKQCTTSSNEALLCAYTFANIYARACTWALTHTHKRIHTHAHSH